MRIQVIVTVPFPVDKHSELIDFLKGKRERNQTPETQALIKATKTRKVALTFEIKSNGRWVVVDAKLHREFEIGRCDYDSIRPVAATLTHESTSDRP